MGAFLRVARAVKQEAANVPLPPGQVAGLVLDAVLNRLHPVSVPERSVGQKAAGAVLVLAGAGITGWRFGSAGVKRREAFSWAIPRA